MDIKVLEVQQWLNKTYSDVSGFKHVYENGQSNWNTIYGLTMGLQHELGISPVSEGFGKKTKSMLSSIVNDLVPGYQGNIAKLIKGAFWCKGISPVSFNTKFDTHTQLAFEKLEENAGLASDGEVSVMLMDALFNMSAFTLIPNFNLKDDKVMEHHKKVRQMQRDLNSQFAVERDLLLPCDGVYQRDTNEELIYALQRAEGLSNANGVYGHDTITHTPTLSLGATGDIVKIIQYGLFVNDFYDGEFNGSFDITVANSIVQFRQFMKLDPQNSNVADETVIKGLLTSDGNVNRDSIAADTSTQLTEHDVKLLQTYGFSVVGRYLTGSVGVGSSKRDKNLTKEEINLITKAGMKIFPIYQDGGWEEKYFNSAQGFKDAKKATKAALELGFPKGSNIYFAVDVDIQDGDIDGTVVEYFKGINDYMSFYNVCVYGTRNVALHVIGHNYAKYAFVSDMSSGYSGNLAFPMPKEWAFDQFVEYKIGNLDIDQVASSGKDNAVSHFGISEEDYSTDWATNIANHFSPFKYADIELQKDKSVKINVSDNTEMIFKLTYGASVSSKDSTSLISIGVKDGHITATNDTFDKIHGMIKGSIAENVSSMLNYFAGKIQNGNIQISTAAKDGKVGLTVSLTNNADINSQTHFNMKLDITYLVDPASTSKEVLDKILDSVASPVADFLKGIGNVATNVVSSAYNHMSDSNPVIATYYTVIFFLAIVVMLFLSLGWL